VPSFSIDPVQEIVCEQEETSLVALRACTSLKLFVLRLESIHGPTQNQTVTTTAAMIMFVDENLLCW